jgi:Na+/H+-dicarboxylate symporter
MTAVIDALAHVMLKITGYVMLLAPVAVFAAIAATVATNGLEILVKFAVFMGDFYIGLIILWCLLVLAGFVFLGRRVFKLISLIKEPVPAVVRRRQAPRLRIRRSSMRSTASA